MRALRRRLRSGRMRRFLGARLMTAVIATLVLVVPAAFLIQRSGATEARVRIGFSLQAELVGSTACFWVPSSRGGVDYPVFPSGWTLTPDWFIRNAVGMVVAPAYGDTTVTVSAASLAQHRLRAGCRGPGRVVRVLGVSYPERGPGFSPPSGIPVPDLPH